MCGTQNSSRHTSTFSAAPQSEAAINTARIRSMSVMDILQQKQAIMIRYPMGIQSMSFERHLFISYAHIDNQPLTPEQQGWVSRFHSSLEAMLSMRMGHKAEIWRDLKLPGKDIFADEMAS